MRQGSVSVQNKNKAPRKAGLTILEMAVYALLGALCFATKVALSGIPNVHLVCVFMIAFTAAFRFKALIPLYVYVFLEGLVYGFTAYWVSYLYVWLLPFFLALLIPLRWKPWLRALLYAVTGGISGITFGALFAPAQALFFHLNLKSMLAWIATGFPYDLIHAGSNIILCGILCVPVIALLELMKKKTGIGRIP